MRARKPSVPVEILKFVPADRPDIAQDIGPRGGLEIESAQSKSHPASFLPSANPLMQAKQTHVADDRATITLNRSLIVCTGFLRIDLFCEASGRQLGRQCRKRIACPKL